MSEAGSRLSRWSRLKAQSRQQTRVRFSVPDESGSPVSNGFEESAAGPLESDAQVAGSAPGPGGDVSGSDSVGAEAPDREASDREASELGAPDQEVPGLPDVDELDASSDYTAFMSDKVSDTVRNMALRKLWRTDSVFANLDGLIDYGEDFTDAATVVEGMKSVYTVGRGMVDYEAEEAAKAAKAGAAESAAEDAAFAEGDGGAESDEAVAADDQTEEREDAVADGETTDSQEALAANVHNEQEVGAVRTQEEKEKEDLLSVESNRFDPSAKV